MSQYIEVCQRFLLRDMAHKILQRTNEREKKKTTTKEKYVLWHLGSCFIIDKAQAGVDLEAVHT